MHEYALQNFRPFREETEHKAVWQESPTPVEQLPAVFHRLLLKACGTAHTQLSVNLAELRKAISDKNSPALIHAVLTCHRAADEDLYMHKASSEDLGQLHQDQDAVADVIRRAGSDISWENLLAKIDTICETIRDMGF